MHVPDPKIFFSNRRRCTTRQGRIVDEARQVAAATPLDCAPCLRARAEVETVARNGPGADVWYAKALSLGPRLPLTEAAWAASRLERGDPAGAAAKVALAVAKGGIAVLGALFVFGLVQKVRDPAFVSLTGRDTGGQNHDRGSK